VIEPSPAFGEASAALQRLTENVAKVIAGNDDAVRTAAICMFADGNLLLEGVPGVGKTTLARELLRAVRQIVGAVDLAGMDVVEVSPPYDTSEITAILAHRVVMEAITALAAKRA